MSTKQCYYIKMSCVITSKWVQLMERDSNYIVHISYTINAGAWLPNHAWHRLVYTIRLPYSHFTISPLWGPEINLTCFPVAAALIKTDSRQNLPIFLHVHLTCICIYAIREMYLLLETLSWLIPFVLYNSNRLRSDKKKNHYRGYKNKSPIYAKSLKINSLDKGST